jgi:hypothetical protein
MTGSLHENSMEDHRPVQKAPTKGALVQSQQL